MHQVDIDFLNVFDLMFFCLLAHFWFKLFFLFLFCFVVFWFVLFFV